ncbi:hypothetical protein BGZ70_005157 [Mortierella alpina]|uniref:Uncharacterized protein n=1 Tax=Mortierella alpina TaxID=64518 RepID=A0A9P6J9V0_MORAP|nr:hypothetical protein BGZ70_005157 [Mortierella alpina]
MARFTLQRGLADIHKLRYHKQETSSRGLSLNRSTHTLSEKARGKLPEKDCQSSSSSTVVREESSCELERDGPRSPQLKRQTRTTAHDVGLNGFVPTEEWVQGWMKTLRFEPLLIMLQCTIPEIESIHAMNDHQVLEYIRTNIIPMLMKQVLPESGKPPIIVRKFAWIDPLVVWFQGLLWSQVYVGGCGRLGRQGMGAWYDTGIRLFCIRTVAPVSSTLSAANVASAAAATVTDNVASVAAAALNRVAGSTFATPTAHSSASTTPSQHLDHSTPRSSNSPSLSLRTRPTSGAQVANHGRRTPTNLAARNPVVTPSPAHADQARSNPA